MSYSLYVVKRGPLALWNLDDTSPFQDHTGFDNAASIKSGSSAPTKHAALVAGAAWASVFSNAKQGQFFVPVFKPGSERSPFALEAWVLVIPKTTTAAQKVFSHNTAFDGITINGNVVSFTTSYTSSGSCTASYDIGTPKAVHVVGVHTENENSLYINGELVATEPLTDAQKIDTYVANDEVLYCGESTSNQEIAVNALAVYRRISPEDIKRNYLAGRAVVPQTLIAPQYDGQSFDLNSSTGSTFVEKSFTDREEFRLGRIVNVEISDTGVYPSYASGLSLAGSWTCAVPLDGTALTSIYGVMVEWSANAVTVEASLDGTSWTPIESGALVSIIPNAYDPTNKDLEIRFSFAGGLADDPAFVESVNIIGFSNNVVANSESRPVTISHPAVLRNNYEPIEYRDDNGVRLEGGTLTIGADTDPVPSVVRTLELWIKPLSGTPTISVTGTAYRNGAADATMPVGEWSLVHIVAGADITGAVTVSGDCIVGQATLYDTPLTAANIEYIYKSYTGFPIVRFTDDTVISITEPAPPVNIYTHEWSIDGGGG